jgi:glycerol kinase
LGTGVFGTPRYVLALDQGTTSSRAVVFDEHARAIARRSCEIGQIYPQPGWVEHDPEEIWQSQIQAARAALADAGLTPAALAAIGIANQRETTLVWNRATGRPLCNAIVWQDRRTAPICEELRAQGLAAMVRAKTGLVIDPYFSASKLAWILEHVAGARRQAQAGDAAFGTVDAWLIFRLTAGRAHLSDRTNASRTLLYNIADLCWDDDLLAAFAIPPSILPTVHPSRHPFAETDPTVFGAAVPIAGVAGDQQAALFGQGALAAGEAKNTYGTGSFLLMHTGPRPVPSSSGLLTTLACAADGAAAYALEGSIFATGAAIQWLRDGLGLIARAGETEDLARSVADTGGVYVVPAFAGLGAPYWDPYARGTIVGITRGTGRAHLARATLESIAYQTRAVLDAMSRDSGIALRELRVDGAAAANDFLMQFQADVLGVPVQRTRLLETTALGAAYLAGLEVGLWSRAEVIAQAWRLDRPFLPQMAAPERERLYGGWQRAVERSRGWAAPA